MRNLVPVRQLLEQAEHDGIDTDFMLADPEDICLLDPDELPEDSEYNPLESNPE